MENNDGLDLNSEGNRKLILDEIIKTNGDFDFVEFRACRYPKVLVPDPKNPKNPKILKPWACPTGCVLKVKTEVSVLVVHQGLLTSSSEDLCKVLDSTNDNVLGDVLFEESVFKMEIKFGENIGDPPEDTASKEYTEWFEKASKLMVTKLMPEISVKINEFRDKYKCPEGCIPDVIIIPDWVKLKVDIKWLEGKAIIELPYKIVFICVKIKSNEIEESSEWRLSGEVIGIKWCEKKGWF